MIADVTTNFIVSETPLITQEVGTKFGLMQLFLFPAKDSSDKTWVSVEIKPLDWKQSHRLKNYQLCVCKVAQTLALTTTYALERAIEQEFGTYKPFAPKRTDFIIDYKMGIMF